MLAMWALPAAPARAQSPAVTVTISSLDTESGKASDEVVLRAVIANTGDVPAFDVRCVLWRSRDPIRDLATLRTVAAGQVPWGDRLAEKPGHSAVITSGADPLAPNGSRTVTLRAKLSELGFTTAGAAYSFGLDVLGAEAPAGTQIDIGQLRTFVTVRGSANVPVTSIVVLSSTPAKLWDGVFVDDHLAEELAGRLDALLTAAARPQMSWLVDPALLDAAQDMADGYVVTSDDGDRPGTGKEAARAWLARFRSLDARAGAHSLFAQPDVAGASAAADAEVLARARTATDLVTAVEESPLVVLPAEASLSRSLQNYLSPAGARAVLSANTVRAGAWQAGVGGAGVLAVSAALGTPTNEPPASRAQLVLAEAVISGRSGQARLLADSQDLQVDTLATTTWTRRRSLRDLLDAKPGAKATFEKVTTDTLAPRQFRDLATLERDFADYGELVPESILTSQAAAALTRAASSAWIDDDSGFHRFSGAIADTVSHDAVRERVTLHASARFVMSSKTNEFPLTITNQLTEAIRVRVMVATDNPQRLHVPPSELVTVGPGQSQTVNIRPEATANGLVTARAHVETQRGRRVTADIPITIEITDLGLVGWAIVLSSGAVVVAATVLRIRQVRRRNNGSRPAPATMDDDE